MTDNDIVKALVTCIAGNCTEFGCPLFDENDTADCTVCMTKLIEHALDLINRRTAEIERLEKELNTLTKQCYKSGIKDLAERLREKSYIQKPYGIYGVVDVLEIDNLVKEMTEETS